MTKVKKVFECTISEILFKQIQYLKRYGDSEEIAKITGFSKPPIDKALNFGHIKDVVLEKAIISFYVARAEYHNKAEKEINDLLMHKKK